MRDAVSNDGWVDLPYLFLAKECSALKQQLYIIKRFSSPYTSWQAYQSGDFLPIQDIAFRPITAATASARVYAGPRPPHSRRPNAETRFWR
jgi:hypothetical protein